MKWILFVLLMFTTPCFAEEAFMGRLGSDGFSVNVKSEGQALWCAWNKKLTVIRLEDRAIWIKCEGDVVNDDYKAPTVIVVDSFPYFYNGKVYDIYGEVKK